MDNHDLLGSFSLDSHVASQGKTPSEGAGAAPEKASNNIASSFSLDEPSGVTAQRQQKEQEAKTKQYKDTTASDVAKGLGSGIELGAAQIVGLPGDIARAGRYLKEEGTYYGKKALENYGYLPEGTADEDWKAVEEARQSPNRGWVGPLPSSEVTEAAAKKYLPGASYEPESRGGAYAHTIGEFVPAMFGGEGSAIKKLGTAAIAGAGSEAAGQATEGTPYEGIARIGGALVSPFAAEKTLSRPLGSVGSAMGVGDEALSSVGLTSGNMAARQKLVDEAARLQKIGALSGLSESDIRSVISDEAARGVAPENSVIHQWSAISNSPTDIVNRFVKNSLQNSKVRQGVEEMYANANRSADMADVAAGSMFNDMHDEATVNALNAQRRSHGLPDNITEAPAPEQIRRAAEEVKQGAWEREVQPVFNKHEVVDSPTLSAMLPIVKPEMVEVTKNDYNRLRMARGENPFQFLTKDQNNKYQTQGFNHPTGMTNGAPLEYWDMLANNLQASQNVADNLIGKQMREGVEQYFTAKGLPHELNTAKQSFRSVRGETNALDAGMRFVTDGAYQTNPAKRSAFLNRWNKMNDVEKGLYQAGVMQQAFSTIAQGSKGFVNWKGVLQNRDNRQLLQEILNFRPQGAPVKAGPSNFDKFNSALNVANAFKRENASHVLASTPEVRTFLGRILSTGDRSPLDIALHAAYRGAFSPDLGYITLLSGGLGYLRQVQADRQALRMLQMFNSKNPNDAIQLARDIAASKGHQTSWQKVQSLLDFTNKSTINFYRRAATAANSQPTGRKEGGRVDNDSEKFIPHNHPKRKKNLEAFNPVKDEKGNPRVFYHGTNKNFDVFGQGRSHPLFRPQRFHFVSPNPEVAGVFAHDRDSSHIEGNYPGESAQNIMPVHVSAKNPWDYENPDHVSALMSEVVKRQPGWSPEEADQMHHHIHTRGGFDFIEDPQQQKIIKDLGHDSFYVHEMGAKNLAVYDPRQIKSATGNSGHFDPSNPDITKAKGGFVDRPQRANGGRIDNKKYGLGMGPEPLQSPKALLKPEKDVSKVGLIKDKTMDESNSLQKMGVIHWDKPVSAQDNIVQKTIRHRLNDFEIKERHKRATGGRVPEADKLFKAAKKELDNSTKVMLNMPDDHIVNALRIAQGRI